MKLRRTTRDHLRSFMSQTGARSADEAVAKALFIAETMSALRTIAPEQRQAVQDEAVAIAEVFDDGLLD